MERRLQSIEQCQPGGSSPELFDKLRTQSWTDVYPAGSVQNTAEAFRLAALILLEDVRHSLGVTDGLRTADCIDQIFRLLESGVSVPPLGKLGSSSYLWPYFIAGCHLRSPRQQAAMFDHIRWLISGNHADSWPRNTMAEQIQHTLMHVWLMTSRSNGTPAALLEENGRSVFVWESKSLPSRYVFEWM